MYNLEMIFSGLGHQGIGKRESGCYYERVRLMYEVSGGRKNTWRSA
ncbi:MAG: hypothetical protein LLF82_001408 [Dehalococcoides mccartyi]|nr:hypothetical protein [Dehalococcoides mccartyi]MEA2122752.1 hypothetical protein [Dehalococcoides mccartyi]